MSGRLPSVPKNSERLSARRRRSRRRALIATGVLFFVLCGAIVYGLSQKYVRISQVVVYGGDQSLATIANKAMEGKYFGLIPRDSTFFFPTASIRSTILSVYPNIAAVSLFRSGLTSLSIKVDYRVPVAKWCGANFETTKFNPIATSSKSSLVVSGANCYFFDASGLLYATTSDTAAVNPFLVYESLTDSTSSLPAHEILGSTLPNADNLPAAFDFARQLAIFGSSIGTIVFRGDEVDDYFMSDTRVTYVLGNEKNAFTALSSARENFNLTDGSVEYVDLRFPGKVYLKKK